MRKNQKYTQEEMYLAIEIWQESGISMKKFCQRESLAEGTFKYWQLKYNKEKRLLKPATSKPFIPIELTSDDDITPCTSSEDTITIRYTNGTEVICPMGISLDQLKILIKF